MFKPNRLKGLFFVIGWLVVSGPSGWGQLEIPQELKNLPWSKARTLTALDAHAIAPTIVADQNGLHVIYQELRTIGSATVSYMNSPDLGKTWINRQVLSSAYSMGVGTSLLSQDGVLHAVWCPTERGINGLNYRRSTRKGESWEREKVLTETERAIFLPKLFLDGPTIYLTWVEKMVQEGQDLSPRAPTVKDLDRHTMGRPADLRPTAMNTSFLSTLNMMSSLDGGENWTPKVVVQKLFEDILLYNFYAQGLEQAISYQVGDGSYRQLRTADAGLVWQERGITQEEFGRFERPSVVEYQGNHFIIAAKDVENRTVIFLVRTDTIPPSVSMTSPQAVFESENIVLTWSGQDDWSDTAKLRYRYRVGQGDLSEWTEESSLELTGLDDGPHQIQVQAMDEAANVTPVPMAFDFEIKRPPDTAIRSTLPLVISENSPQIEWEGSDNTTSPDRLTFQTSLDQGQWQDQGPVASMKLSPLEDGQHTLAVRAVDEAGNADPSPAAVSFVVDTVAPNTTRVNIGNWVPGAEKLVVEIQGEDNLTSPEGLVFALRLDDQPPLDFMKMPPLSIVGLGDGTHRVRVRAKDEAGNVQKQPTEAQFDLEIPPELEIVSAPATGLPKADFEIICRTRDNSTPVNAIRLSYRINEEQWSQALPGSVFRVVRKDLGPGRYRLYVKAEDERGNATTGGPRQSIEFLIDPGAPLPPEQLKAKVEEDGQVHLSWTEPQGTKPEEARYNVYRSSTGGLGTTPEELLNYLIAGGVSGKTYTDRPPEATGEAPVQYLYAVSLVNPLGREGALSNSARIEIGPEGKAVVVASPAKAAYTSRVARLMAFIFVLLLIVVVAGIVILIRRRQGEK